MIFFSTSMYCEAYPIIKLLELKKDTSFTKFQVFKNDSYIIIITGCGSINSAIAITYLLSNYKIKDEDLFINIGVCGTNNLEYKIGTPFVCNKIVEHETKKCFYPDIIYLHQFKEEEIETFSYIVKDDYNIKNIKLIDMESAGLYQAAKVFLKQNQLIFIKIVSDHLNLNNKNITSSDIEHLIEININDIIKWISKISNNLFVDITVFNKNDIDLLDNISKKLKLSISMKNQLKQLLIYCKSQNKDITKLVNDFVLENSNLNCNSKVERKKYFDKLREKLI